MTEGKPREAEEEQGKAQHGTKGLEGEGSGNLGFERILMEIFENFESRSISSLRFYFEIFRSNSTRDRISKSNAVSNSSKNYA